jgi:hypothetical protein
MPCRSASRSSPSACNSPSCRRPRTGRRLAGTLVPSHMPCSAPHRCRKLRRWGTQRSCRSRRSTPSDSSLDYISNRRREPARPEQRRPKCRCACRSKCQTRSRREARHRRKYPASRDRRSLAHLRHDAAHRPPPSHRHRGSRCRARHLRTSSRRLRWAPDAPARIRANRRTRACCSPSSPRAGGRSHCEAYEGSPIDPRQGGFLRASRAACRDETNADSATNGTGVYARRNPAVQVIFSTARCAVLDPAMGDRWAAVQESASGLPTRKRRPRSATARRFRPEDPRKPRGDFAAPEPLRHRCWRVTER